MMMNVCQGDMLFGFEFWAGISESSTVTFSIAKNSGIRITICIVYPLSIGGNCLASSVELTRTHSWGLCDFKGNVVLLFWCSVMMRVHRRPTVVRPELCFRVNEL